MEAVPLSDRIKKGDLDLQDQIALNNPDFLNRKDQLMKKLSDKLPQLPNEGEIQRKVDDEQELLDLYTQMKQKEKDIKNKRQNMIKDKLLGLENKKFKLTKRYKQKNGLIRGFG